MKRSAYLLAIALMMAGCGDEKKAEMVHSVMTVQPKAANCTAVKQFAGQVKEQADVNLGFKTAGQIMEICVKEGQRVRKGQLLARLDDTDYNLGVAAAQAQYDQLKNEVERIGKLYEQKSISANDYEKATYGLEQVRVNLENNRNKVKYTRLHAPQDGIIQRVNFEAMEMVNAGTAVFNILYNNNMEVEAHIPASAYAQRERIVRATCRIGGAIHPLSLTGIVPKADNTQLYKATFALADGGSEAVAGMNVMVSVEFGDKVQGEAGGLTLPVNALFEEGGKSYVWTVRADSTVSRREVTIGGLAPDGCVAVAAGLTGEETIVKAGVKVLHEGERVKIVAEETETNVGGLL